MQYMTSVYQSCLCLQERQWVLVIDVGTDLEKTSVFQLSSFLYVWRPDTCHGPIHHANLIVIK